MNREDYLKEKDRLTTYYRYQFRYTLNEATMLQYNLVSTALGHYLPDIACGQHASMYNDIILNKKLSILEQNARFLVHELITENLSDNILELLSQGRCIVCTFHTGSYRLINHLLVKMGVAVTLVMGKEVIAREGHRFLELCEAYGKPDALRLLNAENSQSGLQMLRELKSGRVLVFYIDGNTGAGKPTRENGNCCVVNFLQHQLYARKGIAYLAHAAGVPVITAASYRVPDGIRLRWFEPIYPLNTDRHVFALETTQKIYDLVAPLIKQYPEQWENWLYLHQITIIKTVASNPPITIPDNKAPLCFNWRLFGIFKVNGVAFLFRKSDYTVHEIDLSLFDCLTTASRSITKASFEETLFNELYRHRVLADDG